MNFFLLAHQNNLIQSVENNLIYSTRMVPLHSLHSLHTLFPLAFKEVSVAVLISITDVSSAFTSWLTGAFDF